MASSKYTRDARFKLWLFRILDWICLALPIVIYVIIALCGVAVVAQKVAVVSTVMVAIILTLFNVISQKRLRCPVWIVLIGLYIAIKEYLLPLVIILAITSVLDDLVFTPLISYYRTKLIANKAMDERLPDEKEREQDTSRLQQETTSVEG